MWLIAGLGNPGVKYRWTRHNVGFLCLDYCLKELAANERASQSVLTERNEHKAITVKYSSNSGDVLWTFPQTFMNLSGDSIQSLMAYYKIPMENLLVIQDDLDLAFGRIRFQKNRGAGGHNGIRSITERLGSAEYARLKIGVGAARPPGQTGADFVLDRFSEEEAKSLGDIFEICFLALKCWWTEGFEKASSIYNQKNKQQPEKE